MNIANFKRVLAAIDRNPEQWDQTTFHDAETAAKGSEFCGTYHCFAGWAHILDLQDRKQPIDVQNLPELSELEVIMAAERFLDISPDEADWLFKSDRAREDFDEALARAEAGKPIYPEDFCE